jgi:hypothetical protein
MGESRIAPEQARVVSGPAGAGPNPALRPELDLVERFAARCLDPTAAVRTLGQHLRSTVYVGDQLIVSGEASGETLAALDEAARRLGYRVVEPERVSFRATHELARSARLSDLTLAFSRTLALEPAGTAPTAPADAWVVLQTFRSLLAAGNTGHRHVQLNHLLRTDPIEPSRPAEWMGPEPHRLPDHELRCRRPVVAVFATGAGTHPWLRDHIVLRNPAIMGVTIGAADAAKDPDRYERVLDADTAHGTFLAGLVRQVCPDANVLAVRVMDSAGAVPESELLEALKRLLIRQTLAQAAGDPRGLIDVVCLPFGCYHESARGNSFDPPVLHVLRALGERGVAVVAAAGGDGDDGDDRPKYPAAFFPHPGGEVTAFARACVPVISVGAHDVGRDVAAFSNYGPWVACQRPGEAMVSTLPGTLHRHRSGYGSWSGTSFAAAVLAGEIAASLFDGSCGSLDPPERAASVARGWAALSQRVGISRP